MFYCIIGNIGLCLATQITFQGGSVIDTLPNSKCNSMLLSEANAK